jgi:hypothetical protein
MSSAESLVAKAVERVSTDGMIDGNVMALHVVSLSTERYERKKREPESGRRSSKSGMQFIENFAFDHIGVTPITAGRNKKIETSPDFEHGIAAVARRKTRFASVAT